ncbi:SDR family NAD(P)-dependent oxidoreductase [Streptomyces coeruleorubidus]
MPNSSPPRRRCGSPPTPSRASAARATPGTSPSSATCARPRSCRSSRAPTRSSASSAAATWSAPAPNPPTTSCAPRPRSLRHETHRIRRPVTGGASGLGRATAAALLHAGAHVVIADLPSSPGAAVAEELAGAGPRIRFVPTPRHSLRHRVTSPAQ